MGKTIHIAADGQKRVEEAPFTNERPLQRTKKVWKRNTSGLKPCKPGETHNPHGRPVGSTSIKSKLKRLLAHYRPPKDVYNELKKTYPQIAKYEDCTIDDAIMARVLDQALRGDDRARDFVADRTEGKVATTMKIDFNPEEVNLRLNGLTTEPEQDGVND